MMPAWCGWVALAMHTPNVFNLLVEKVVHACRKTAQGTSSEKKAQPSATQTAAVFPDVARI